MPTRVKVTTRAESIEVTTSVLLNTGFTGQEPDVLIPKRLAERLRLWPPPEGAILESLDTAGGEVLSYVLPGCLEVTVLASSGASKPVRCNVIVSTHESEVLVNDAFMEEVELEILSPKTGAWRLRGKPTEMSVEPEHW